MRDSVKVRRKQDDSFSFKKKAHGTVRFYEREFCIPLVDVVKGREPAIPFSIQI